MQNPLKCGIPPVSPLYSRAPFDPFPSLLRPTTQARSNHDLTFTLSKLTWSSLVLSLEVQIHLLDAPMVTCQAYDKIQIS